MEGGSAKLRAFCFGRNNIKDNFQRTDRGRNLVAEIKTLRNQDSLYKRREPIGRPTISERQILSKRQRNSRE